MNQSIEYKILLTASPAMVWNSLTDTDLMREWMGEPEMQIKIVTDWGIGNPITISGFHHGPFCNTGKIMQFDLHKVLAYSHLSSVSHLPDIPANHTILTFTINPLEMENELVLTMENFPTESIYWHMDFYWRNTLVIFKQHVEKLI